MSIRSQEVLLSLLEGYGLQTGEYLTAGNIYYVDSGAPGAADVTANGGSWDSPFATSAFALSQCTASNGDVIYLAANHAETIATATALAVDVAGITIIGLGFAADRPTFSIGATDVAGAIFNVDAANVTIRNVIFKPAAANTTLLVDVDGAGFTIEKCELVMDVGDYEAVTGIDIATDDCTIKKCVLRSTGAGADEAIAISSTVDNLTIEDCHIEGDWANAGIWSDQIFTLSRIANNFVSNTQTGDHAIEFTDECTGILANNRLYADTAGSILDPGSMKCVGNIAVTGIDDAGRPIPATTAETRVVLSSQMALDGGAIEDVFTVTGPCLIDGLIMHLTEAVSAHACAVSWVNDVTVGATDMPLCGALDINAFAIADDIYITGLGSDAAVKADAATNGPLLCTTPAVVFAGGIDFEAANNNPTSGIADVYIIYRPLTDGAEITAA